MAFRSFINREGIFMGIRDPDLFRSVIVYSPEVFKKACIFHSKQNYDYFHSCFPGAE